MTLPFLGQSHFTIPVTPLLLFSLLAFTLAWWLILTLVFRYHWKNYGANGTEILTMNFLYLMGSIILVALMILAAFLYYLSTTP